MAVVALNIDPAGTDLPLDEGLVEQLSEDELVALISARFRHFVGIGLGANEALASAVGVSAAGVGLRDAGPLAEQIAV